MEVNAQTIKEKLRVFIKNPLVRMVLLLLIVTTLGLWIVNMYLHSHTRHGQSIVVPDFSGMTEAEVKATCEEKLLNYEINKVDFDPNSKMNAIIYQQPTANSKVKQERTIYLTINESEVPLKPIASDSNEFKMYFNSFPLDVVNKLRNRGFKIDPEVDITYKSNISTYVLRIEFNGDSVDGTTPIPVGSSLKIIAGNGNASGALVVPFVGGSEIELAKYAFFANHVKLGSIKRDKLLGKDEKGEMVVYKTDPVYGTEVKPDELVDLHVTTRENYKLLYEPQDSDFQDSVKNARLNNPPF